jgi:hypothetical protein
MSDEGYVDYFEVLELGASAKPGEVRNAYKRKMKSLVAEIARVEITGELRAHYLLEMAKLNAALCILRDGDVRETYCADRQRAMELEQEWRDAVEASADNADALRREFDTRLRSFLSRYVEEQMLTAGRDKECIEISHWDEAHERHAHRILRHFRQRLYRQVLERLPYHEVTPPQLDWTERSKTVEDILMAKGA